jgi:hypothetical protein
MYVKDNGYVLNFVDVLDILMLLKYLSAIHFEHCVMMSNYVIVVYMSFCTYMVRIRFVFQNRV